MKFSFGRNVGIILTALWLLLFALTTLFHATIPDQIMGIVALLAAIFLVFTIEIGGSAS